MTFGVDKREVKHIGKNEFNVKRTKEAVEGVADFREYQDLRRLQKAKRKIY